MRLPSLRYHPYLVPKNMTSKIIVLFACDDPIQHDVKSDCEVLQCDAVLICIPDEKKGAEDTKFRNSVSVTVPGGLDASSSTVVRLEFSIDPQIAEKYNGRSS